MKKCSFIAILLMFLICTSSIFAINLGGVSANWYYFPLRPLDSYSGSNSVKLGEFYYAPEEIVPGGKEPAKMGQNHLDLIHLILYENSKGYGLNINKKPIVHNYLKNPGDVVYCDQHTTGGHLKFLLDDNNTVNKLFFCIEKVSDTEYIAYTFSYDEMMSAKVNETRILTFKTILRKIDGVWDDVASAPGYATVIRATVDCGRSIDVSSWVYELSEYGLMHE